MLRKSPILLSCSLLLMLTVGCAELRLTSEQLAARTRDYAKDAQLHAVEASRSESIARRALFNARSAEEQAKDDLENAKAAGTSNSSFRRAASRAERDRIRTKSTADSVFMYARRSIAAAKDAKQMAQKIGDAGDRAEVRAHERTAQKLLSVAKHGARRAGSGAQRLKDRWLSFIKEDAPEKGT